jgi:hypothetical protein
MHSGPTVWICRDQAADPRRCPRIQIASNPRGVDGYPRLASAHRGRACRHRALIRFETPPGRQLQIVFWRKPGGWLPLSPRPPLVASAVRCLKGAPMSEVPRSGRLERRLDKKDRWG